MKKEKEIKDMDYISLAEYSWNTHMKNDLDMDDANDLKAIAFNEPDKKLREKKNIQTPLLRTYQWNEIWTKYYESKDS